MSSEDKSSSALHELELKISHLLRAGVLISGTLLLIGWLWNLIQKGDILTTLNVYHPHPLWETIQSSLQNHDEAQLVSLTGVIILVLMPIIRVLMTGILFLKEKDYRLAIMAFGVFTALAASFFLGIDL